MFFVRLDDKQEATVLRLNPPLWFCAFGGKQNNEIVETYGWNKFPANSD